MNLAEYRAEAALRDGTPVIIRAIRPGDRQALRDGFLHLSERTIYHRFFRAKRDLTDAELQYLTELDFSDHIGLVVELSADGGGQLIAVARAVRTEAAAPGAAAGTAAAQAPAPAPSPGPLPGVPPAATPPPAPGSAAGPTPTPADAPVSGDSAHRLVPAGGSLRGDRAEVAFVVGDEYQGRGVGTLLLLHLAGMARQIGYRGFEAEVLADNRQMLEVFEHSGLALRQRVVDGVIHVEMDL